VVDVPSKKCFWEMLEQKTKRTICDKKWKSWVDVLRLPMCFFFLLVPFIYDPFDINNSHTQGGTLFFWGKF